MSLNYNSFYNHSTLRGITVILFCKKMHEYKFTTIINVKISNLTLKISILSEEISGFISKSLSDIRRNYADLA